MSYTIRYNRATNHIDGVGCRTASEGKDMGDRVSYYAVSACSALTRSGSRMAVGKSFEALADALAEARLVGGRKLCKSCEKAAVAQLAAEVEEAARVTEYTVKTTDELSVGDVVVSHGMRVLLETAPRVNDESGYTVYAFDGRVINMDEVKEAGHVPLGYLRTYKFGSGGWVADRNDAWVIQGNRLARWTVEN